jgi:hypothetical protein
MIVTITSFSYKRGLPEEKMAIGNIGTGSISTLAKLNTGRDHLQVAFGCTGGQHRSVYFAERMAERLLGIEDREIFSFWYTYNKGKQGDTMNKPKNYCQVVKRSLP